MKVQCFGCKLFAKSENCTLRKHKISGIRRWFHKVEIKPGCVSKFNNEKDWEEVERSLGETTDEEMQQLINKF